MKKIISRLLTLLFFVAFAASTHAQSNASKPANIESASLPPISSCEYEEVAKLKFYGVSIRDATDVCRVLANRLGRPPSSTLLDGFAKLVFIFHAGGMKAPAKEISYQAADFMEYRGHLEKEDKAKSSLNVIVKIFNGLDGRVQISDLNEVLYSMGARAKKLSDEDMYTLASLIMQEKRKRGG